MRHVGPAALMVVALGACSDLDPHVEITIGTRGIGDLERASTRKLIFRFAGSALLEEASATRDVTQGLTRSEERVNFYPSPSARGQIDCSISAVAADGVPFGHGQATIDYDGATIPLRVELVGAGPVLEDLGVDAASPDDAGVVVAMPDLSNGPDLGVDAASPTDAAQVTTLVNLSVSSDSTVTTISYPELTTVTGQIYIGSNPNLTTLSLPKLNSAGAVVFYSNPILTQIVLPNLQTVSSHVYCGEHPALQLISLPKLTTVMTNQLDIHHNVALTTFVTPMISTVGGTTSIQLNSALCLDPAIDWDAVTVGSVTISGNKATCP